MVGSYDTIGRHFKQIYDTAGSLDFLCCSYYDDQEEANLAIAESCLLNKHKTISVYLQLTCLATALGEDDLEYAPEKMIELNQELPELRDDFLKAIIKEFSGLCRNKCFSLEVLPEERSPISTRVVLNESIPI